jgi:transposase
MGPGTLLPVPMALAVEWIRLTPEIVQIGLMSQAATCICPCCAQSSARVHGHYVRKVQDSPAHGRAIELLIGLRRFVCDFPDCPQQTFAEQMPELMQVRSRKTCRLVAALQEIGLAAGGEAGARLAEKLSMPASAATLLRLIRQIPMPAVTAPRVLGVDDWAFRRGRVYGTILCDLESHRVIDLLPERSAFALSAWLKEHPGAEIISRDRGGEYAKGAALGAPQAKQVADRFHLVHNLIDAFERGLDRQQALIDEAAKAAAQISVPASEQAGDGTAVGIAPQTPVQDKPPESPAAATTKRQQRREQCRNRRKALYDQVQELHAKGVSLRQIARQVKLNPHTVQRYAYAQQFPEFASHPAGPTPLDGFVQYLKQRWEEGCRKASKLHDELKERGFTGSIHMVRRQLTAWRDPLEKQAVRQANKQRWRPSVRSIAWLLLDDDTLNAPASAGELAAKKRAFRAILHQKWPELAENVWLVHEFRRVLLQDDPAELEAWVALTGEPTVMPGIRQFAKNLRQDWDAVVEAIRQPWSNGQVEGQVNRLKMIKRQMYGRANFDLLTVKVLQMN